ncbi:MAG: DUF202 domain-containing protein [Verrucomicrobiae bacterium]|nr:DUF202 domain-containing protein [Verrucomicrobiae bacterium]
MIDPRIFFAAERTLLAWIRTGLTVIALGFAVSRFGLFLNLLAQHSPSSGFSPGAITLSNLIGIALVLVGTITILVSSLQHRNYLKTLTVDELPPQYHTGVTFFLSNSLVAIGLVIAVYLFFSTH